MIKPISNYSSRSDGRFSRYTDDFSRSKLTAIVTLTGERHRSSALRRSGRPFGCVWHGGVQQALAIRRWAEVRIFRADRDGDPLPYGVIRSLGKESRIVRPSGSHSREISPRN